MTAPTLSLSMIGQSYSFKSKNPNDPTVYTGVIKKFVDADDAAAYRVNLDAYNKACRLVDSTIPESVSDISTFFIIKLTNVSGTQDQYPFCAQWVAGGSWTALAIAATVTIEVLDTNTDHTLIISALASQGYPNATITKVSSSS